MNRIKKLKVKQSNGTFSDYIPFGVDSQYVDFTDGKTLDEKIAELSKNAITSGSFSLSTDGWNLNLDNQYEQLLINYSIQNTDILICDLDANANITDIIRSNFNNFIDIESLANIIRFTAKEKPTVDIPVTVTNLKPTQPMDTTDMVVLPKIVISGTGINGDSLNFYCDYEGNTKYQVVGIIRETGQSISSGIMFAPTGTPADFVAGIEPGTYTIDFYIAWRENPYGSLIETISITVPEVWEGPVNPS